MGREKKKEKPVCLAAAPPKLLSAPDYLVERFSNGIEFVLKNA